jgi:DDE family transposase
VSVIDTYTAGDPMHEGVQWTNLRRPEIAARLSEEGFPVSVTVVDRLLEEFQMGYRTPQKIRTMTDHPDRNKQFEHIDELKRIWLESGEPILSMDTKRREMLGDYARPGQVLSTGRLRAWDHDFPTHSPGVVIPHGLFDLGRNEGYMHLGTSHDTSDFAIDAFLDYWRTYGCRRYPRAEDLLLLCDGGGSCGYRRLVFKEQLQRAADETGLRIRVAHYPTGCSKYNPIEHRLFPHITRVCQGIFLASMEQTRDLMRQATTSTGLRTFVRVLRRAYETGKKALITAATDLCIGFDEVLPQWNYVLFPKTDWEVI